MSTTDQQHDKDPDLHVHFDPLVVRQNAIHTLFRLLRELDLNAARTVLAEVHEAGTFDETPYISVGVNDEGVLFMGVDVIGIFLEVYLDPTKFDRTNPAHEEVLQKCAALVQMIHESPITSEDDHPQLYPFVFWKWPEIGGSDEVSIGQWAKLAEVWAAAAK